MSIKIDGGAAENIIKAGTSNQLLYNDEEIFLKKDLLDFVHPVGSIYWSSNDTDPAILFGGTWVRIKDKFLWAMGDNDTLNSTGGEKTVAIRTTDLPDHHHIVSIHDPGHRHLYYAGSNKDTSSGNNTNKVVDYIAKHTEPSYTGITATATTIRDTSNNSFDQTSVDKMPPYIVKYCWERTA